MYCLFSCILCSKNLVHGMRLDYAVVSAALTPLVQSCEILDRSIPATRPEQHEDASPQVGGFMGSDHCPVVLTLSRLPTISMNVDNSTPVHNKKRKQ